MHLFTIDDDIRWCTDAEADLVSTETNDCDDDIATDAQGFIGTAAEDVAGTLARIFWCNSHTAGVIQRPSTKKRYQLCISSMRAHTNATACSALTVDVSITQ